MSDSTLKPNWETRLREAATNVEAELKKAVTYINDEVMPDVRRNSSEALRSAAKELHRLAEKMEDAHKNPPPR